jgi:hypothetical protein
MSSLEYMHEQVAVGAVFQEDIDSERTARYLHLLNLTLCRTGIYQKHRSQGDLATKRKVKFRQHESNTVEVSVHSAAFGYQGA